MPTKMYEVFDITDTTHCINIGQFDTLEKATKAAKEYGKSVSPSAVIKVYEMIREE